MSEQAAAMNDGMGEYLSNQSSNLHSLNAYQQEEDYIESIFHVYSEERDGKIVISIASFLQVIKASGLWERDPRLIDTIKALKSHLTDSNGGYIEKDTFKQCIYQNVRLIGRALRGDFVIPEFSNFVHQVKDIYNTVRELFKGTLSDYIPQLSRLSPRKWGVAICTVDGQRFSIGDCREKWCLQSCSKCINYAIILDELGGDKVHQYIGREPSGRRYHDMVLNQEGKPYNAMINQGGIMICALMKPEINSADRFTYVRDRYKQAAGNAHIGFDLPSFLSEKEIGHHNYALAHHMLGSKSFPANTKLNEVLDLYLQLCSLEVNCESGSVIAGTIANGGVCPTTGEKVFSATAVRDTLSIMNSCGMSDYTGRFAFEVGLPAKSGISGGMFIVIPNIMGICTWSPLLDDHTNSVRGVEFCKKLVEKFNFHCYQSLITSTDKTDPRISVEYKYGLTHSRVMVAAASGDLSELRRCRYCTNMEISDYDARTPLHVAAIEGHYSIVKYLLETCKVSPSPKDRWGRTPLDDASMQERKDVIALITDYINNSTSHK